MSEIAGIFVQGSGTAGSIVGGAVGGVVGALAAGGGAKGSNPLAARELGYLSVGADQVTLYGAKRKVLLGGFAATDKVVTAVPRGNIAGARFEKGTVVGKLEVALSDGSTWVFEVPRVGNKTVDQAVAAMAPAAGPS